MYLLKGDIESFFAIKGFILDRYLRLQIPISWLVSINSSNISRSSGAAAIRTSIGMGSDLDDSDALSIDLNSNDASSHIQVIQGTSTTHEESLHDRGLQGKGGGDDYEYEFESHYFHGTYRVLIIRVQDKFGNEVNQSEEQLHNDFFTDENNLVRSYYSIRFAAGVTICCYYTIGNLTCGYTHSIFFFLDLYRNHVISIVPTTNLTSLKLLDTM